VKGCRGGQTPPTGQLATRLDRREQERRALHAKHAEQDKKGGKR
jgi:hypothetical protein